MIQTQINPSKNYRPDEVAEILNVDIRTVYRLLNEPLGNIPSFKLKPTSKGNIRIPGTGLINWINCNETKPWE